jgi:hypothetical protein
MHKNNLSMIETNIYNNKNITLIFVYNLPLITFKTNIDKFFLKIKFIKSD